MLALPLFFTACDNDDVDGPSDTGLAVDFPQGDNDYDKEFVSFKENYGTMVLYKFTDAQFRWAVTEYIPYYSNQADEAYVPQAWKLIKEGLDVLPESLVKQCMPYQMLLCDSIWSFAYGYDANWNYVKLKSPRNSCYGYSHIAFGFANKSVTEMTSAQKKAVVGDVAYALIGYASSKGKLAIPESFDTLFTAGKNYYTTSYSTYGWGYNCAGTLDGTVEADNYTVYHDFATYVKNMITMSPETFESTYMNSYFDCGFVYDANYNQIPTPRVSLKYNAVLTYFKETLGIDLSAIGTKVEQME